MSGKGKTKRKLVAISSQDDKPTSKQHTEFDDVEDEAGLSQKEVIRMRLKMKMEKKAQKAAVEGEQKMQSFVTEEFRQYSVSPGNSFQSTESISVSASNTTTTTPMQSQIQNQSIPNYPTRPSHTPNTIPNPEMAAYLDTLQLDISKYILSNPNSPMLTDSLMYDRSDIYSREVIPNVSTPSPLELASNLFGLDPDQMNEWFPNGLLSPTTICKDSTTARSNSKLSLDAMDEE